MSEQDKTTMENGIETIGDDELDAVAGGSWTEVRLLLKRQAIADGRHVTLNAPTSEAMCCGLHCVYAKDSYKQDGKIYYRDVKCYKCGKTAAYYPPGSGVSGR